MSDPATVRLTPAQREMLEFIARGGERGRMLVQVVASGSRSAAVLDRLRHAGLIEYHDPVGAAVDFVRATAAGRALVGEKP